MLTSRRAAVLRRLLEHDGPGPHENGSPQAAHAGGGAGGAAGAVPRQALSGRRLREAERGIADEIVGELRPKRRDITAQLTSIWGGEDLLRSIAGGQGGYTAEQQTAADRMRGNVTQRLERERAAFKEEHGFDPAPSRAGETAEAYAERVYQQGEAVGKRKALRAKRKAETVMRRVLEDSAVAIRLDAALLGHVLNAGFQNQHATGTSKGLLNPTHRKAAEDAMFNTPDAPPSNYRPEDYPIYGYLESRSGIIAATTPTAQLGGSRHGLPNLQMHITSYGDTIIVLKDSVKDRSTFTVGDSLDTSKVPAPVNRPRWSAAGSRVAWGPPDPPGTGRFWEAQIHGGVRPQDIAEIIFRPTISGDIAPALAAFLRERGIPYRVRVN